MPKTKEATHAIGTLLRCISTLRQSEKERRSVLNLFQWKMINLSHQNEKLEEEVAQLKRDWGMTSHNSLVTETMLLQLDLVETKQEAERAALQADKQLEQASTSMQERIFLLRLELAEKPLLQKKVTDLCEQNRELKDKLAQTTGEKLMRTIHAEESPSIPKKKKEKRQQETSESRTCALRGFHYDGPE